MKTDKASESTTNELKEWLQKPGPQTEAGLGISVQQDLEWINTSKDLSSITLNEKEGETIRNKEGRPVTATSGPTPATGGGGGGGFMALFGCAGKRK